MSEDLIAFLSIILGGPIMLGAGFGLYQINQTIQNHTFQQAYNKNMECRMKVNNPNPAYANIMCGSVPRYEEFVK